MFLQNGVDWEGIKKGVVSQYYQQKNLLRLACWRRDSHG